MSTLRIALDLMGSDDSPESFIRALLESPVASLPLEIACYIENNSIRPCEKVLSKKTSSNIFLVPCKSSILPDEDPLQAIRKKKDSTLLQAIASVNDSKADAFISLGSTGALIGAATLFLKRFDSIKRPCLVAKVPSKKGFLYVADVGGNPTLKPDHVVNNGFLAAAYANFENPDKSLRLGFLNIGQEGLKGSPMHREAFNLLEKAFKEQKKIEFIGNIEPKFAFSGKVDVLAADGLAGNIFLKTSEGMAEFIFDTLKSHAKELLPLFDYTEYPGALVGGVDSLIIKCHGYSNPKALVQTILKAKELLEAGFIKTYQSIIEKFQLS